MQAKDHWENVYSPKASHSVSWFQEHAERSMQFIRATGVPLEASLIDIGGGASTLVDDLLAKGFKNLSVLDISGEALNTARNRIGVQATLVQWIESDITTAHFETHAYDLWHDRAVFHFINTPEARVAYIQNVLRAVKPHGHIIIATFAEDGPTQCSGLPVTRYSAEELHAVLGSSFSLVKHEKDAHHTPSGAIQHFVYCYFQKNI